MMDSGSPKEKIVISLGGSLVVPNAEIDVSFVSKFKALIEKKVKEGLQFFIIVGGGKTARKYQNALKEVSPSGAEDDDMDWVGIYSTRLNARFLQLVFKDLACEQIIDDPTNLPSCDRNVTIGAGWKPGWSTDYVSVEVARTSGSVKIVNLSNITHVYTEDPKLNPSAEKITEISWDEYRSMIPDKWVPGANAPFDPIASKKASEHGFSVAIMDGGDLLNLESFIDGAKFEGTVIRPSA